MLRFRWITFDRFKVVNLSRFYRVNFIRPYWVNFTVFSTHGKNVYFLREELEQWLLQNPVRTAEQKDREATEFVLRKRRPR